jgi:hypothetical protein
VKRKAKRPTSARLERLPCATVRQRFQACGRFVESGRLVESGRRTLVRRNAGGRAPTAHTAHARPSTHEVELRSRRSFSRGISEGARASSQIATTVRALLWGGAGGGGRRGWTNEGTGYRGPARGTQQAAGQGPHPAFDNKPLGAAGAHVAPIAGVLPIGPDRVRAPPLGGPPVLGPGSRVVPCSRDSFMYIGPPNGPIQRLKPVRYVQYECYETTARSETRKLARVRPARCPAWRMWP